MCNRCHPGSIINEGYPSVTLTALSVGGFDLTNVIFPYRCTMSFTSFGERVAVLEDFLLFVKQIEEENAKYEYVFDPSFKVSQLNETEILKVL